MLMGLYIFFILASQVLGLHGFEAFRSQDLVALQLLFLHLRCLILLVLGLCCSTLVVCQRCTHV